MNIFNQFNPLLIIAILVFVVYYWLYQNSPTGILSAQQKNQPPFYDNINTLTVKNPNYRKVIYTTDNFQLVLMTLQPGEEIGLEQHPTTTQFIRVEEGHGLAIINHQKYALKDDMAIVIPPDAQHNIINIHPTQPFKLYSIYTPPQHPPKTIQPTKSHHHDH